MFEKFRNTKLLPERLQYCWRGASDASGGHFRILAIDGLESRHGVRCTCSVAVAAATIGARDAGGYVRHRPERTTQPAHTLAADSRPYAGRNLPRAPGWHRSVRPGAKGAASAATRTRFATGPT